MALKRIRRAFTLVELLITLALLSVLLIIAYEIMTKMFASGTVTQWESVLTNQFTNADSRVRDFLNASSYPSLLTPQGVFQANIIDMYPRTTAPAEMMGVASIGYDADLPAHLLVKSDNAALPTLSTACAPMVLETGSLERFQLAAKAVITPSRLARLQGLAPDHPAWQSAVRQLADKTRALKPAR